MTYQEIATTKGFIGFKAIMTDAVSFPVIIVCHNDYQPEKRFAEYQAKGYPIEPITIS